MNIRNPIFEPQIDYNMKKCLWTVLLVLLVSVSFAQKSKLTITYYDETWMKVKNKKYATFYQESYTERDTLFVTDFYLDGNKQMVGQFSDRKEEVKVGFFVFYAKNGSKESEGNFANNKREGGWKYYHPNGTVSALVEYRSDSIIKAEEFNENGVQLNENDTLNFADNLPKFSNDPEDLYKFISKKIQYPTWAKRLNIDGKVVIRFVVDKNVDIVDVQLIKSAHPTLDEEALRVVKSMPSWFPGTHEGKPVCIRYTLPILFKLGPY